MQAKLQTIRIVFLLIPIALFFPFESDSQGSNVFDYIKSIDSLDAVIERHKIEGDDSLALYALLEVSKIHYSLGDYEHAINAASEAKQIALQYSTLSKSNSAVYLGNYYAEKGDYSKALNEYKEAVSGFEELNELKRKSVVLSNIAVLFEWTKNDSLSLKYHFEALAIKRTLQDSMLLAVSYMNLANTYSSLGDNEKSYSYYDRALSIYKSEGEQEGISSVYNNIGYLYQHENRMSEAFDAFYSSYKIDKLLNDNHALVISSFNIGSLYFESKNMDSALLYLNESLKLSKELNDLLYLQKSSKNLVSVYLEEKNIEEAKRVFENYTNYSDSLYNEEKLKNFIESKNNLLVQKKEYENQFLVDQEKANSNLIFWEAIAAISLLFLLLISILTIYRNSKSRKKLRLLNETLSQKNNEVEKQKEHLEDVNTEKDNLMSILAHDLRSPLSGIKGLNSIIKEEGNFNDLQVELSRTIDVAADSGIKLINDILIIKKMEEGDEEMLMDTIEPNHFLQTVEEVFSAHLIKKKQSLKINLISEEHLISNKEYLSSIIENIVSNAIKYSPPGKPIFLSYFTTDESYCFSVRDEGQGIPKEEMHLLFEKFQKLSPRPTDNEFSTGLGLFICKSFLDKLDGKIEIDSEVGRGSTFTVILPKLDIE